MTGRASHRKGAAIGVIAVLAITGIAVAAFAFGTTNSNAATQDCGGLDTALHNNLNFIAGQRANPDAQSEARIANRQAVVDLTQQCRVAAGGAVGQVVCAGSTVTLSGGGGAPAASGNQFPVGTTLKVTNLDNDKATTVKVTSASGSCALLNDAASEQVREPGEFLIRRARIERVG